MPKSKSSIKSKSSSKQKKQNKLRNDLIGKGVISDKSDFHLTETGVGVAYEDETNTVDRSSESGVEKLDKDKYQMNVITGEDLNTRQNFTIADQQRVSKYNPQTELITVKKSDAGVLLIDEYSAKGDRLSTLGIFTIDSNLTPEQIDKMNQGQLRAVVKDNEMQKDIPKWNSLGHKQLKIQIKKVVAKRKDKAEDTLEKELDVNIDLDKQSSEEKPSFSSVKSEDTLEKEILNGTVKLNKRKSFTKQFPPLRIDSGATTFSDSEFDGITYHLYTNPDSNAIELHEVHVEVENPETLAISSVKISEEYLDEFADRLESQNDWDHALLST